MYQQSFSHTGYYYNRLRRLNPDVFRPKRLSSVNGAATLVQQMHAPWWSGLNNEVKINMLQIKRK
jgi:hypothetical protein